MPESNAARLRYRDYNTMALGYAYIGVRNVEEEMRMNIHLEQGAIPTITVRTADDIKNPFFYNLSLKHRL